MKKLYLLMIALCPLAMCGMDGQKTIAKLKELKTEPVWEQPFIGCMPATAHLEELKQYNVESKVVCDFIKKNSDKLDLDFKYKDVRDLLSYSLETMKKNEPQKYMSFVCTMVYCAKGLEFVKKNDLDTYPINKEHFVLFKDYVNQIRANKKKIKK